MQFPAYLSAAGIESALPRNAAEIFEAPEARDLSEPLSTVRPALRAVELEALLDLAIARHRWLDALDRTRAVTEGLQAAGLAGLPAILGEAPRRDRISALGHIVRSAFPAEYEHSLAFYDAALDLSLSHSVGFATVDPNHPRAAQLAEFNDLRFTALELPAESWFTLRRGVLDGAVTLRWEHPIDAICDAAAPRIESLAAHIARKGAADFFKERFGFFDACFEDRLSAGHEETIRRSIAAEYRALLEAAPIKVQPLGAVFVGSDKQRIGLALLDKKGAIAATSPLRPTGDWTDRVLRWMRDQKARLIVLPSSALAADWLTELDTYLTDQKARGVRVSAAAMAEARSIDDPQLRRVSPEEASAIVLLRRASKPIEEWTRIEPARLGLSRVQGELDASRLNETLQIVRERVIASAQPLSSAPVVTGGLRARPTAPLNPDITSIRDVRPGLSMKGVITNVTKFGAFVNLGLKQEGLVHISELADEFVAEPADVVQSGQQVSARVISVDVDRGRIALSLRSEAAAMRGPPRGPGRPMRDPMGGPPRRMPSGSASARPSGPAPRHEFETLPEPDRRRALSDLEALFKKPAE